MKSNTVTTSEPIVNMYCNLHKTSVEALGDILEVQRTKHLTPEEYASLEHEKIKWAKMCSYSQKRIQLYVNMRSNVVGGNWTIFIPLCS